MSVPHLDARFLDGKRVVLFGPFATFSTKFLKNGSFLDLLSTTTTDNVLPMTHVGLDNFDLVKYLISGDAERRRSFCGAERVLPKRA